MDSLDSSRFTIGMISPGQTLENPVTGERFTFTHTSATTNGKLLAFAHMDGAASAVGDFAQWKGRSAATIHVASAVTAGWGRGPPGLATWEGGVPVFSAGGDALGGVGVSGAQSAEDVACAKAGIAAAGLKETGE